MEKYGSRRQVTDDSVMRCILGNYDCNDTRTEYVLLSAFFHSNSGFAKMPHCYVIRLVQILYSFVHLYI